ncbi:MAG TPA: transposase domain-containing protein [Streptosporangiaceae bacterium]|nr:transposase domain-containing protein [Streptosporangiaceae bacterium]
MRPGSRAGRRTADGLFAPGHLGELTQIVPFELVDEVLADSGGTQHRLRKLPARVVACLLLAAALFEQASYPAVWRKLTGPLEGLPVPKITATALWHARVRLGPRPLRALFDLLRGPAAGPGTAGTWWAGMLVCAIDGTCLDVPDSSAAVPAIAKAPISTPPPAQSCAAARTAPSFSRIGQVKVRITECEITIATSAGRRTGIYRLATTLLDPHQHPAFELVSLYHERWVRHEVAWCEWNSQEEDRLMLVT